MAITNARFYDVLTRHQIYIEGVKLWQSQQFNVVMQELERELRSLLAGVKYKTLDGLTKAELAALLIRLRNVQTRIFSKYAQGVEKFLVEFMTADLAVSKFIVKRVIDEHREEESESPQALPAVPTVADPEEPLENTDKKSLFGLAVLTGSSAALVALWSLIRNQHVPANGAMPLEFLRASTQSAATSVEQLIRKGYANRSTPAEVIADIVGSPEVKNRDGVLSRIYNQSSAVTDTLIQHVSSIISAAVQSHYFARYTWSSVIDGVTTEVCRSRNGRTYSFGSGPLPPAHIRCRSKITPLVGTDTPPKSYAAWIKNQPEAVQIDILGGKSAQALRDGKLPASELPKFDSAKPISIDQFSRKLGLILTK